MIAWGLAAGTGLPAVFRLKGKEAPPVARAFRRPHLGSLLRCWYHRGWTALGRKMRTLLGAAKFETAHAAKCQIHAIAPGQLFMLADVHAAHSSFGPG